MATTYEKIASVTVGSGGAASIDFTSIAADWDDLLIKLSPRNGSGNTSDMALRFNGNSGNNYSQRHIYGDGAAAFSGNDTNQNLLSRAGVAAGTNATASTFSNVEIYIPNYAGSTNKSLSIDSVSENNGTTAYQHLIAGLWSQTAAITSVTLYVNGSNLAHNFAEYSIATLYGIKKS